MINLEFSTHPVRETRIINDDLFELIVERNGMEFTPGDCVAIYTEDDKSRPYSIASGAHDTALRFVIRKMDGGEVSPWLIDRQPGDVIRITPPFGWFRPGQDIADAPFVFMATGTGIAPFLSYLRTFDRSPEQCLFGVRREADAIGYDLLLDRCPTRLAISRQPPAGHHHGRITDLLHLVPIDGETHYYCCGLESMVNDVAAWLVDADVPLCRIHREVFFHG